MPYKAPYVEGVVLRSELDDEGARLFKRFLARKVLGREVQVTLGAGQEDKRTDYAFIFYRGEPTPDKEFLREALCNALGVRSKQLGPLQPINTVHYWEGARIGGQSAAATLPEPVE
jgi:hypothetical protein